MTKEQYLKVIERIINSPRNDIQKITMLKYSFEAYVKDAAKDSQNKDEVIEYLLDMFEEEHMGMRASAIKEIKNEFGIDL